MHRDAASPVLSPDALRALAEYTLSLTSADTVRVRITHVAIGSARVARDRLRVRSSGDRVQFELDMAFGQRVGAGLDINQLDPASLRQAVAYLERTAHEQRGDPTSITMPVAPRTYLPNTCWHESTAAAFGDAAHVVVPPLVRPILEAKLHASAFVGVYLHSTVFATKEGILATGQETDVEMNVTGWTADGKGSGWAGQVTRDWNMLHPDAVAAESLRLTQLAANPVAFEPGRRVAILDRPAVAQLVRAMGSAFDAASTWRGQTPLYNRATRRPKIGEHIMDPRITVSTDPNDREGGYLPFDRAAYPLVPMTFVERGVHTHLAYDAYTAASHGIVPANDAPDSLRMSGGPTSVADMIAGCKEGIYVNRLGFIEGAGSDPVSGMLTGVTTGACFLVRDGKIEKSIKPLRFLVSPWLLFNQLEAIGSTERTAFGSSPWFGDWPIAPTIVPPLMVRDFNFVALAANA